MVIGLKFCQVYADRCNMTITQERVKELFDYRDGCLYWKASPASHVSANSKVGAIDSAGYLKTRVNRKPCLVHRIIFLLHHGYMPEYIDHINRNRLDNNISNLRAATQSQNHSNKAKKANTSSKFKGVGWSKDKRKWKARCKKKFIGHFTDELEAARAYDAKAKEVFGEYALLNFP